MRALRRKLKVRLPIFDQFGGGCTEKRMQINERQGVDKMKSMKLFAVAAAVMMLAVAGIAIVSDSNEIEAAPGSAGSMNVYLYNNSTWSVQAVDAYNGMYAIMGTTDYSASSATINSAYTYVYYYNGDPYTDITYDYGTITKFMNVSNDDDLGTVWNVLVYTKNSSNVFTWNLSDGRTGWYKPFQDYADYLPAYGTANIALYYGTPASATTMITSLQNAISSDSSLAVMGLTSISKTQGSVFEHTFYIKKSASGTLSIAQGTTVTLANYTTKNLTAKMINDGTVIVGYGSDTMLALIDAVGSANVSFYAATEPQPGYNQYGWMNSMFGITTAYDPLTNVYTYWQSYTQHTGLSDSTNVWAGYGTGAYSALTNAPLVDGSIAYVYC